MKRWLETVNRYYGPSVRAANQGLAQWRRLQPQLQRLRDEALKAADYPRLSVIRSFTFARGGWHDAPLMEMVAGELRGLVDNLADKPDEEVRTELDRAIPEYFRRNEHYALEDMVDRWDLYPGWRRHVFQEALWAHKSRKYALSVPALAPQIEGILRHETDEYGINKQWIRKVNEVLGFEYDAAATPTIEDLEEVVTALRVRDIPERYREAERISLEHALFRVNELYNTGPFSDPDFVNSVNRHAILHGVAEDFDELTSIKLFCSVQLVHEIVIAYREATES